MGTLTDHTPTLRLVTAEARVCVFAAGRWHPGRLRQWALYEHRGWVGWVHYVADGEPYVGTFPAARIREGEPPPDPDARN